MMTAPAIRHEGNLRLVSTHTLGLPDDPQPQHVAVLRWLQTQPPVPGSPPAQAYGPLVAWFDRPPANNTLAQLPGRIGTAIVGLTTPGDGYAIDDFRDLHAYTIDHRGPLEDVPQAHAALADEARRQHWQVRPYWRVAWQRRRLEDDNILPELLVSVFVDPPAVTTAGPLGVR